MSTQSQEETLKNTIETNNHTKLYEILYKTPITEFKLSEDREFIRKYILQNLTTVDIILSTLPTNETSIDFAYSLLDISIEEDNSQIYGFVLSYIRKFVKSPNIQLDKILSKGSINIYKHLLNKKVIQVEEEHLSHLFYRYRNYDMLYELLQLYTKQTSSILALLYKGCLSIYKSNKLLILETICVYLFDKIPIERLLLFQDDKSILNEVIDNSMYALLEKYLFYVFETSYFLDTIRHFLKVARQELRNNKPMTTLRYLLDYCYNLYMNNSDIYNIYMFTLTTKLTENDGELFAKIVEYNMFRTFTEEIPHKLSHETKTLQVIPFNLIPGNIPERFLIEENFIYAIISYLYNTRTSEYVDNKEHILETKYENKELIYRYRHNIQKIKSAVEKICELNINKNIDVILYTLDLIKSIQKDIDITTEDLIDYVIMAYIHTQSRKAIELLREVLITSPDGLYYVEYILDVLYDRIDNIDITKRNKYDLYLSHVLYNLSLSLVSKDSIIDLIEKTIDYRLAINIDRRYLELLEKLSDKFNIFIYDDVKQFLEINLGSDVLKYVLDKIV